MVGSERSTLKVGSCYLINLVLFTLPFGDPGRSPKGSAFKKIVKIHSFLRIFMCEDLGEKFQPQTPKMYFLRFEIGLFFLVSQLLVRMLF